VLGGINATITGSVTSASYVEYSNVANKPTLVSGSTQVSFNGITDKPTLVSGSSQVTYSGLSGIPVGIVSGSAQVSFNGITDKPTLVSGSSQVTYSGLSGIPAGIVSSSTQIVEYNVFATTGSNQFNGSQAITGSLTVTGQVVAQTLNVQQVTSSIVYSSGSNIFGNTLGNTQQFTGSLQVSGSSHYLFGNVGVGTTTPSASLHVTDGYVLIGIDKGVRFDTSGATGHPELSVDSTSSLNFKNTAGSTNLTITNGGNLGLGVTPSANSLNPAFDLKGGAGIFGYGDANYLTGNLYYDGAFKLKNAGTGSFALLDDGFTIYTTNGGSANTSVTATSRLRLTNAGVVQIGNDTNPYLEIANGGSTDVLSGIRWVIGSGRVNYGGMEMAASSADNGYIVFKTRNSGSTTERMRITSGGNIGIGTTNPQNRLTVNTPLRNDGGTNSLGALVVAGAISSSPSYDFTNNTAIFRVQGSDATNNLQFGIGGEAYTFHPWIQGSFDNSSGGGNDFGPKDILLQPIGGRVGVGSLSPSNVVDIYDTTQTSNTVGILGARTRGGGTFITGRIVPADVSNQTVTIATMSASGGNERIFIKVQVVNVSAVNNYGNVHVGYALWIGGGSSTVTTMTLDTGNSNISNSSVGTLSWSGNNLQYTTNRLGNYELNSITIWGSARDTGVIT
jgi:hypothetical protein